jgi:cholesterol transport system auxiliary component
MKKLTSIASAMLIMLSAFALAGCTIMRPTSAPPTLYDLGPLRAATIAGTPQSNLPAISIAEIRTPIWLDSQAMYYRLAYANDQQPRPYAGSRWATPPVLLFSQRLKLQLAQAGGVVLSAADGAINIPVLHIEADDFTQTFSSPEQSLVQVAVRASVFNGRTLVAQKTLIRQVPAPSADAAGGARALASASDAVIAEMIAWLSQLPTKK